MHALFQFNHCDLQKDRDRIDSYRTPSQKNLQRTVMVKLTSTDTMAKESNDQRLSDDIEGKFTWKNIMSLYN